MNEQEKLELFDSFTPFFISLSKSPIKKFARKDYPFKTSRSEAEEIKNELEVYFFELLEEYDPTQGNVRAYLSSFLSWKAHHLGEKVFQERKTHTYFDEMNILPEDVVRNDTSLSEEMLNYIEELPNRQKQVIRLMYNENLRLYQAAKEMGITRNAAFVLKKEACKKLAKKLNN